MAGGGFGDMSSLLKQAQDMQRRMQETQRALAEKAIEGQSAGGAVVATVNGSGEVQKVRIDPQVIDPADADGLEDLVLVAIQKAQRAAKELHDAEMAKVTGGMNLPGMGF